MSLSIMKQKNNYNDFLPQLSGSVGILLGAVFGKFPTAEISVNQVSIGKLDSVPRLIDALAFVDREHLSRVRFT